METQRRRIRLMSDASQDDRPGGIGILNDQRIRMGLENVLV